MPAARSRPPAGRVADTAGHVRDAHRPERARGARWPRRDCCWGASATPVGRCSAQPLLALVAALSGRAPREIALVALTVLLGQAVLGWHNDLVDRERDRAGR